MAENRKTIKYTAEQRTYIKGKFQGKFYGYLDELKITNYLERYFDIKIYEGLIKVEGKHNIRLHSEGAFEGFTTDDSFPGKLPDPLSCMISLSDEQEVYSIQLYEPKFEKHSIVITKPQDEGSQSFGTIEATITGYILEIVEKEREVEQDSKLPETTSHSPVINEKTTEKTGKTEQHGEYIRYEYYKANRSGAYWGPWIYTGKNQDGCGEGIGLVFGIGLLIFFIAAIGLRGLMILGIFAGSWLLLALFASFGDKLIQYLGYLFGLGLLLLFVSNFIKEFRQPQREKVVIAKDDKTEVSAKKKEGTTPDSIISHHRIWKDYAGKEYEGNLEIRIKDFYLSTQNRDNLAPGETTTNQYDYVLNSLTIYDKGKLGRIYYFFDSLQTNNQLDRIAFANTIVSCIQDIPYTLILNDDCNPGLYNDDFIQKYLSQGYQCEGDVKFGLFAPVEFMGSLKGDCDTRTLLLFTIFSHYNYDVAVLSSEFYKHSLLGINLPFEGVYKQAGNKKYYAWETTSTGFQAGNLPREIADMSWWRISLLSNPKNN